MNGEDNPLLRKQLTFEEVVQRMQDHYDYKKLVDIPDTQAYNLRITVNNQILERLLYALSKSES